MRYGNRDLFFTHTLESEGDRMLRKTMKMLVVALIAAFALSSVGEAAAAPKKTRHRTRHSSRVASGAVAPIGKKAAANKRRARARSRARARASVSAQKPLAARKAPAAR